MGATDKQLIVIIRITSVKTQLFLTDLKKQMCERPETRVSKYSRYNTKLQAIDDNYDGNTYIENLVVLRILNDIFVK